MNAKKRTTAALSASAIVVALGAGLIPAGPVAAQGGTATTSCSEYVAASLSVSNPSPNPGDTITVSGSTAPNSTVSIQLVIGSNVYLLGNVVTNASGSFSTSVTIPADAPAGPARIQANDPACNGPLSVDITIGGGGTTTTTPTVGECGTDPITIHFDGTRLIDWDGYNPKVEYTGIEPISLAAGTWNIIEAVSRDSYPGRVTQTQTSEIWEIEFLSGSTVVARSAPTEDLADMIANAEWIGPLGSVTLTSAIDGVRAHHLPDQFPDAPWGQANSVDPISFTICTEGGAAASTTTQAGQTTTTQAGQTTTTQAGDVDGNEVTAPSSAPSTTAGSGVGGATTVPGGGSGGADGRADVKGETANRSNKVGGSNLAWTGSTTSVLLRIGAAAVMVGALILLKSRRQLAS